MDLCTNFEALHQKLIQDINSSGLTIGGAIFVLKDVYNTLYLMYKEEIIKEQNKENQKVETHTYEFDEDIEEEKESENGEQNND